MELQKNKTNPFIIPLSIFLLNVIIKSIYLSNRDIALDEPFSIYYGQMDLKSIIAMLYNENNPPLHFFILHFVIKLFGIGPVSVRITSLLFSSLTAVIIYKIGNKFFTQIVGIGASLIFTFSTMHIFFSHEARVYPLFSLLTAASLYFFLQMIKSPSIRKNYYWLTIINIFLIYGHYFGFFVLFMEVFSLIIIKERKAILKPLIIVMLFTALAYIPILIIFMHRLGESTGKGTWVATPGITELYGNLNRFLNNKYNTLVLLILISFSSALLIYKKKLMEKTNELLTNTCFKIVALWFIIPYLIMFIVSFKFPMFIDRYILYTSIPFFILVAILLHHLFETPKFIVAAFSIFIISQIVTIQLNPDNNRRLKDLAKLVTEIKKKNTAVILSPDYAYMGFCYYYNPDYFKQAPKTLELLNNDKIFPISNDAMVNELIDKQNPNSLIYIQAGTEFNDPNNLILKSISAHYKNHQQFHVPEIYEIHLFTN